jgi:acyl-CoA thioesterase-2
MSKLFFDLRATHNPHRWYLPLTPDVCVGREPNLFMYGGVGLGAAIAAMERTCERPVIWATAQYLSYARPPAIVDLDVWVPVAGRNSSQVRVVGHVGDTEIFTVNAALGSRPAGASHQWVKAPDMPAPDDCETAFLWPDQQSLLHGRLDVRMAKGRYGQGPLTGRVDPEGRMIFWVRPKEDVAIDASLLAIIADNMPAAIGPALGQSASANSLDNTLRVRRIAPTDWVLCEIRVTQVHHGYAYGDMHLFAQDGELMATASQSVIVRMPNSTAEAARPEAAPPA